MSTASGKHQILSLNIPLHGLRGTENHTTNFLYCEAQARVREGSARDGLQGERPQSLKPCLELTLKLVATTTHHHHKFNFT